jgi:hypothetical protein
VTWTWLPDDSLNGWSDVLTGATSTASWVTPIVLVLVAGSSPMVKSVPCVVATTASVDAEKLYSPFSVGENQKRANPWLTWSVGVGSALIEIVVAIRGTDLCPRTKIRGVAS